jgi:hypothetical protein
VFEEILSAMVHTVTGEFFVLSKVFMDHNKKRAMLPFGRYTTKV